MTKKRRQETELGMLMIRNMAAVMEREREKRDLGKVEFAKDCKITALFYLSILAATATPTLFVIIWIAQALSIPVREVLLGDVWE